MDSDFPPDGFRFSPMDSDFPRWIPIAPPMPPDFLRHAPDFPRFKFGHNPGKSEEIGEFPAIGSLRLQNLDFKVHPAINWSGVEVKVFCFFLLLLMSRLRISWGRHAEMLSSRKKCDFLKNEKMTLKT